MASQTNHTGQSVDRDVLASKFFALLEMDRETPDFLALYQEVDALLDRVLEEQQEWPQRERRAAVGQY